MSAENLPHTTLCYNKTHARTGLKHIYKWTLGSFVPSLLNTTPFLHRLDFAIYIYSPNTSSY